MPPWRLIIDPRAEEEARAAFLWYLDRSSRAAEGFQVALEEALASVAEAPHRWPEVEPRIRKRVLRRYPYSLLYTIDGSAVTILVVMHQRRRPGYWKSLAVNVCIQDPGTLFSPRAVPVTGLDVGRALVAAFGSRCPIIDPDHCDRLLRAIHVKGCSRPERLELVTRG